MQCSKCGGELVEIKGEFFCMDCGEQIRPEEVKRNKVGKDQTIQDNNQSSIQEPKRTSHNIPKKQIKKEEKKEVSQNLNSFSSNNNSLKSVDSIYPSSSQANESHPVLDEYDRFVQAEEKESRFRFEVKLAFIVGGILVVSSLVLAYIFWWTPKLKVAWYFSSINENISSLEKDLDRAKTLVDILKVNSLKDLEDMNKSLQLSNYLLEEKKSESKPVLADSDIEKSINTSKEGVDLCRKSLEKINAIKKMDIDGKNAEIKNTHNEILSRINELEEEFNELNSVFTFIYVDSNVGKEFVNIMQNVNIAETQSYSEFVFLMDTTNKRLTELTAQLNLVQVSNNLKKMKENELQVINIFNNFINEINISIQSSDMNRLSNAADSFEGQLLAVLKIEYGDLIAFWQGFTYERDINESKTKVRQASELLEKIRDNHKLDRYRVPLLWYGNEII